MTSIAFTGHRPGDLPGVFGATHFFDLVKALDDLGLPQRKGDLHFITGGALGVDTWAAEYAIQTGIPFSLILPFPAKVMGGLWWPRDRENLQRHIDLAHSVTILSPEYDVSQYQKRNIRMVDAADHIYAVWTGKPTGGTYNCVQYALRHQTPIQNLWHGDTIHGRIAAPAIDIKR